MSFGVREFELSLMHRMRDLNAARVEDALRDMGASRAELRAAHARWTRMLHSPRPPRNLRRLLGPPSYAGTTAVGSLTCRVSRWALPSWPGLEFEVLAGPGGEVWNQWFVRPSGPRALAFGDVEPWSCVVGDVGASFPGAVHLEGQAPHHWAVDVPHEGATYRVLFVYGLCQRVEAR
ncbi:hypothetical protein FH608_037880 [Nonomuraea phyllanthi]|uniref:Uncharacterized protein n=1 Tax=Nonomuraea phyllanthi TaxID=2219224 RepID=A0A5C4VQA4_9ACTN|nr:hypothetical protein [Nonomuraea phyllanthi]KAB8189780.1 hypothetical protein FH608_037880 [Nonomuraea phyllanthi]QFY08735.1 hypothetical protein GBF35_20485 [Nonomuraea phyllanthi]